MPVTFYRPLMRNALLRLLFGGVTLLAPHLSHAQATPTQPKQLRNFSRPLAETFASVGSVFEFENGTLLINDPVARRLWVVDSAFEHASLISEGSASRVKYGASAGGLLAFRGDSAVFIDQASHALLVLGPTLQVARVFGVPNSDDTPLLIGGIAGWPAFDADGRLVYRGQARTKGLTLVNASTRLADQPDTAPVLRFHPPTRRLDTLGYVKIPKPVYVERQTRQLARQFVSLIDPFPLTDAWGVGTSSSIILVRGRDYSSQILHSDGSLGRRASLPFDWIRLTDTDKQRIVDSLRTALEKQSKVDASIKTPGGGVERSGITIETVSVSTGSSSTSDELVLPSRAASTISLEPVPAASLPDYLPPFVQGSARSDREGRLWIRLFKPRVKGSSYDVIGSDGRIFASVLTPPGSVIAGFGLRGHVYVAVRDSSGVRLTRAQLP